MKRLLIFLIIGVWGCSKAQLPLTPLSPTTLAVIAIDDNGNHLDSAKVFIDGSIVGSTPLASLEVQPGLHALRVMREGFRIYTEQVLIEDSRQYTIEAVLNQIPIDQGQLLVTVNLDSALIRVFDSQSNIIVETTERASAHSLLPGAYTVFGEIKNSPRVQQNVEIKSGKTSTVNIEFDVAGGIAPSLHFNIAQDTVNLGDRINLMWQSDGVQVIIDQSVGVRGPSGTESLVFPTAGHKIFTATAYSFDNLTTQVTDSVYIKTVESVAPQLEFFVLQDSVEFGQAVIIEWHSDGFQVIMDQGVGVRGPNGSEEINFRNPGKKVFTATAYGADNMLTVRKDSVVVQEALLPENPVLMLSTTRLVTVGHQAAISWQSQNADYVVVDYVMNAEPSGNIKVTFSTPGIRIVTATAFNQRGYVSTTDTIEVVEPVVNSVDDILLAAESSVRADRGDVGYSDINAATFEIESAGRYQVLAEVWYNSGDSQLNESYYLNIADALGSILLPRNGNAGNNYIVADDPGEPHTISRQSGVFKFEKGVHSINVFHYAKISTMYPMFLNGEINGPESVKILGFKLIYIGE